MFLKVIQLIKKLNNTELGKSGMHDTYVLIPKTLDISDIFLSTDKKIPFKCKQTGEIVFLRYTTAREKRIVGLGPFYSKNMLTAGDEVELECIEIDGKVDYFIDLKKDTNSILIQKFKNGFEILNEDKIQLLSTLMDENGKVSLEVKCLGSEKKRSDAPNLTNFYDVIINGESIANKFNNKDYIEVKFIDGNICVYRVSLWQKYIFEMGD